MIITFANYSTDFNETWVESGLQSRIDPINCFGVYPDK